MSEPRQAASRHVPGLDGLRGLAVLGVVGFHAYPDLITGGGVGVAMFFVLSGYLITVVLIKSPQEIWAFWWRRSVRLAPALLPFLAFVYGVGLAMPRLGTDHLWSLLVEGTFYLTWPVAVALAPSRRFLFRLALILGLGVLAWRVTVLTGVIPYRLDRYRSPDVRMDAILFGSALAAAHRVPRVRTGIALAALGVIVLAFLVPWPGTATVSLAVVLPVVILASMILVARASTTGFLPLNFRPLCWLGEISYALFLWHVPVLLMLPFAPAAAVALSTALAALSWYGIERPALVHLRSPSFTQGKGPRHREVWMCLDATARVEELDPPAIAQPGLT